MVKGSVEYKTSHPLYNGLHYHYIDFIVKEDIKKKYLIKSKKKQNY